MRYAARVDANQAEIVAALRNAGANVWIISLPVDLLVGYAGKTALMEVKTLTGKRAPKAAGHTQLQKDFMLDWNGGTVATVTDIEGALRVLAAMGEGAAL
jgi:nucleoside diphosphate kinase